LSDDGYRLKTGLNKSDGTHDCKRLSCNCLVHKVNVWRRYKPVKLSALIEPLKLDFEALVRETFSDLDNKQFLENVEVIIVCQLMHFIGSVEH